MIISDKHQFAFIHIPKSAGTTVRQTLMPYDERRERYFDVARAQHPALGLLDHHHIPLAVLAEHFADDFALLRRYRTYALLRDPLARFGSSLHEYVRNHGQVLLSDLSPEQQRVHIDAVLEKLRAHGSAPITDQALIHFSRQSDYVELDGERIVDGLYPLEQVDALIADLAERIGTPLTRQDRNRRVEYSSPLLAETSGALQRGLRRVLPDAVRAPLFGVAKRMLLAIGGAAPLKEASSKAVLDAETEQFVRHFYARDFALRAELTEAAS